MRQCRFCHHEIADTSRVCEHCGKDLFPGHHTVPSGGPVSVPATSAPPWQRPALIGGAVVVAIGVLLTNPGLFVLLALIGGVWWAIRSRARSADASPMYCQHCGSVGRPTTRVKGSFWIEVILWICLLFPGLIYTVWRLTTKERVCPACGTPGMIPADSPKAKAALKPAP